MKCLRLASYASYEVEGDSCLRHALKVSTMVRLLGSRQVLRAVLKCSFEENYVKCAKYSYLCKITLAVQDFKRNHKMCVSDNTSMKEAKGQGDVRAIRDRLA